MAAFLSTVSKLTGFSVLFRILSTFFSSTAAGTSDDFYRGIETLLYFIAALSMLYGSTMAVRQKDLKRMMASSGVAHAGYLLAGKGNLSPNRLNAMAFYFFSYLFMMAGIFAIVLFLEKKSESPKKMPWRDCTVSIL